MAARLALLLGVGRSVAGWMPEEAAAACSSAEGGDATSHLQTGSRYPGCPCKKLVPELTGNCTSSRIGECTATIESAVSVKTTWLPNKCASSIADWKPAALVYEITNDKEEVFTMEGPKWCSGSDFGVYFSYAMSCFGAQGGKCVEESCMSCKDGAASHPDYTCTLEPGETKYMTVWYKDMPKCCDMAKQAVTKTCGISNLMECIGEISNEKSAETEFKPSCAEKHGLKGDIGASVYRVTNDVWKPQALKAKDFCFNAPFPYAMSCFGDQGLHCEEQGCIGCKDGEVSGLGEACDFKIGETKFVTLWFEKPQKS
mmetsp:Transcript_130635/g.377868  ORF Transcript_130635/g.377868 Transcript_130635/m.377868 type:complete len:314 (-) Transcript_130635:21-962(-)